MATGVQDPHIYGFNGDFFHFHGIDQKCFNLFSSPNLQVNALFKHGSKQGGTTMQKAGIKAGRKGVGINLIEVSIVEDGLYVTFNGEPFYSEKKVYFTGGLPHEKSSMVSGRDTFSLWNGCYLVKAERSNEGEDFYYLNMHFNLTNDNGVLSDGVLPHGVIGQTANPDRKPKTSDDFQGGGVIEGEFLDYMVSDLFADDFKYNRFGASAEREPQKGVFPHLRVASVLML